MLVTRHRARLASRRWSGPPGRASTRRVPTKGFQLTSLCVGLLFQASWHNPRFDSTLTSSAARRGQSCARQWLFSYRPLPIWLAFLIFSMPSRHRARNLDCGLTPQLCLMGYRSGSRSLLYPKEYLATISCWTGPVAGPCGPASPARPHRWPGRFRRLRHPGSAPTPTDAAGGLKQRLPAFVKNLSLHGYPVS